ncbi:MAG: PorT family protein [Prevotellaceae bacterium]|nr:PorT family protein [Prevotellaceae bacterium]
MRKVFLSILLTAICLSASAQLNRSDLNLLHYEYASPLRFGFSLGINIFDFSTVNALNNVVVDGANRRIRADVTTMHTGFDINAIIDYRIKQQWNLRTLPGISFGARNLEFYDDNTNELLHTMKIGSNYIELPVHLKFSVKRNSNFRPYVFAGVNGRYNLSAGNDEKGGVFFGLNNTEVFGEFGFGFEFYLVYFKFSIEAKFSTGAGKVKIKNPVEGYEAYYNAIDKLYSNMFMIKFHFE